MMSITYQDIGKQEEMTDSVRETTVALEIVKLVAKVGDNTQGILEKGSDNQKACNRWDVRFERLQYDRY